jgi:hypothetical protein
MKKSTLLPLVSIALLPFLGTGCATIVHGGPRSIPVATTPPGAKVTIYNTAGQAVSTNTTPFIAVLETKRGYFKGQSYRLVMELPGYKTAEVQLKPTVSGWYWGNLIFGGLLGMLVVDPLTGAMYNLSPEHIEQPLNREGAALVRQGKAVMVILKTQATESELRHLQPIPAAY